MKEWTADEIEELMADALHNALEADWGCFNYVRRIIATLKDNGLHIVPIPKPIADEIEGDMA